MAPIKYSVSRRTAMVAVAASSLAGIVLAQDFPSRPVKLVVPYPAGGFPDAIGRLFGQRLAEMWKQPVVVENRAGANGNIGTQFVAKSPPDGYTLLLGNTSTHGANSALYANLGYEPEADFEPVVQMTQNTWFLGVTNALPVKSVAELVAYAKANPGKINYGSFGPGSGAHLAGALFGERAGIDIVHVPYKGTAASLQALMAGEIQLLFDSALITQQAKTGKIQLLATTAARRWPGYASLPTLAEAGVPDFVLNGWLALFAPRGTPPDVVARLNADIVRVLAMADIRQRLSDLTLAPGGGTSAGLRQIVQAEMLRGREMVRISGAKLD